MRCASACDDPYAMVDDAFLPLEVVYARGGGWRPASGSALEVEGAEVSAVRRQAGMLEVRVFNPTDRTTTVRRGGALGLARRPAGPHRSSPSTAHSSSGPSGSPPSAPPPDLAPAIRRSPFSRSSSRSWSTSASRSQRPPEPAVERHGLGAGAVQHPQLDPTEVLHPARAQHPELESSTSRRLGSAAHRRRHPTTAGLQRAAWNSSVTITAPGAAMFTTRLARLTTGP